MALSKQTVLQIIEIVAQDAECQKRVNSWLNKVDIADSGTAGIVRNFAIGLAYGLVPKRWENSFDPSERESMAYLYSCDGIAEATSIAINAKIKDIEGLTRASEQARKTGYSHTGTLLEMTDNTKYVLDWWKSLSIRCPFVFKYDDFMYQKSEGTPSTDFKGFV